MVRVYAKSVTPSGKKNLSSTPNANIQGPVEIQTLAFENPTYVVSGIQIVTADANSLQYEHILQLYRQKYARTTDTVIGDSTVLQVKYGDGVNEKMLSNVLGESTGIRVLLEDYSYPIDVSDSKSGYMPTASLTFMETK